MKYRESIWTVWETEKEHERALFAAIHLKEPHEPDLVERFTMDEEEKQAAQALAKCTYLPGSFEKRFARDMDSIARGEHPTITAKQRVWLWKQVHRYRKQIKDKILIKLAETYL